MGGSTASEKCSSNRFERGNERSRQFRRVPAVPTLTLWASSRCGRRAAGEGSDVRLFTARFMRIGGATDLHAVGANELTISLLGRWSSDCAPGSTRAGARTVAEDERGPRRPSARAGLPQLRPDGAAVGHGGEA